MVACVLLSQTARGCLERPIGYPHLCKILRETFKRPTPERYNNIYGRGII
jgi:hypothetical protein